MAEFLEGLSARDVKRLSISVVTVIGVMCIVASDAPGIAAVRSVGVIVVSIERVRQGGRIIEIGNEIDDVKLFWEKKSWGIRLTR